MQESTVIESLRPGQNDTGPGARLTLAGCSFGRRIGFRPPPERAAMLAEQSGAPFGPRRQRSLTMTLDSATAMNSATVVNGGASGVAMGSERSLGPAALPEGQEVRLAVLAMVGTTVFDGGLMERAMSRTLVEQGVPEGSAAFAGMLGYARDHSGI